MEPTFYEILKCDKNATYQEIKTNYHRLAKIFHPDKNTANSSENVFNKIQEAWLTLKDPEKRQRYDALIFEKNCNQNCLILDEILVQNLEFDVNGLFEYPCRCGSVYSVDKHLINNINEKYTLECNDCSFALMLSKTPL